MCIGPGILALKIPGRPVAYDWQSARRPPRLRGQDGRGTERRPP